MLIGSLPGAQSGADNSDLADKYAGLTDGLTLRSIGEINRLAIDRGIDVNDIDQAVRTFRVGIPDNPWLDGALKARIRGAPQTLGRSVKGQPAAIRKAVDIQIRSTVGLTGAQTTSSSARPQGVLFFAGPTGVGKTELAKSLAKLIFGRDDSYLRFDMSEFASEHAEARLIGAPPGYIGHSGGGELTNAVRQQPFRLILFDEIEKAHPRILDKFLQVLEDGRLTDGNGSTVYFSETMIVFTSNLGVYTVDSMGERVPVISRGSPYPAVESAIRAAVAEHFTKEIGRPELLNRIGDNIVVFDFISEEVAIELIDMFVANVIDRVKSSTGRTVKVSPEAVSVLRSRVVDHLDFGGRGVSNAIESMLINPLARWIFDHDDQDEVDVVGIERIPEGWAVLSR